jgi:hypothetical protein
MSAQKRKKIVCVYHKFHNPFRFAVDASAGFDSEEEIARTTQRPEDACNALRGLSLDSTGSAKRPALTWPSESKARPAGAVRIEGKCADSPQKKRQQEPEPAHSIVEYV